MGWYGGSTHVSVDGFMSLQTEFICIEPFPLIFLLYNLMKEKEVT
jgi:hypothetical protein